MSLARFAAFSDAARPSAGEDTVAALEAFLLERRRGSRIEPGYLARELDLDPEVIDDLLEIATEPEVRVLEPRPRVRCPKCGVRNDESEFREAVEEEGVAQCPDEGCEIEDLDSLPVEAAYDLTEEADAEAAAHQEKSDKRPHKRALLLCALDVELEQVTDQLKRFGNLRSHTAGDLTRYYTVDVKGDEYDWTVAVALTGTGNNEAAAAAMAAVQHFEPDQALYIGIAGGIIEKGAKLGDVVVASDVQDYSKGKSIDDGFIAYTSQHHAAFGLVSVAHHVKLEGAWSEHILTAEATLREGDPDVHVEPIAAGNHVVAGLESDTYELVRQLANRAVAVEMEGAGFLTALRRFPAIQAGVIRGVSDLIAEKGVTDKQGWQRQACANAAAFAVGMLIAAQVPQQEFRGGER